MKQACILVAGMHRSGTSALSGVLSMLGVYLGSNEMPGDKYNQKGYFENNNLVPLSEDLLDAVGSKWDDIFFNEDKTQILLKQDITPLKSQIEGEFKECELFAIKDPRIAFLIPVYKSILEELGIDIKVIIPFRNPLEVASSLRERDGMSIEKGVLLWLCHFLLVEKHSRGLDRVFISFDSLVSDTENVVESMSKKLSIDFNTKYADRKEQINAFLEPGLKHHNLALESLPDEVAEIVKEILGVQGDFKDKKSLAKFDDIRERYFSYQKLFYNHDVMSMISGLSEAKQNLVSLESTLHGTKSELEETKLQLLGEQQQIERLNQKSVTKERQLEQLNQKFITSVRQLEHARQQVVLSSKRYEKVEQTLENTKLSVSSGEHKLVSLIQRLDINEQLLVSKIDEVSLLKDELMAIYAGRSWKLMCFFKKINNKIKRRFQR
jgi:hypothetical protein